MVYLKNEGKNLPSPRFGTAVSAVKKKTPCWGPSRAADGWRRRTSAQSQPPRGPFRGRHPAIVDELLGCDYNCRWACKPNSWYKTVGVEISSAFEEWFKRCLLQLVWLSNGCISPQVLIIWVLKNDHPLFSQWEVNHCFKLVGGKITTFAEL
jgi:hypothetical protein